MLSRTISLRGSGEGGSFRRTAHAGELLELFHENTKYTRSNGLGHVLRIRRELASPTAQEAASRNYKVYRFAEQYALPAGPPPAMPLGQALRARTSERTFSGAPITLETLARILIPAVACNRTAVSPQHASVRLHFRSYPSGGGEYPVEIYPVLLRIAEAPPLVTHFDPRCAALSVVSPLALAGLEEALMSSGPTLRSAAVLLVLTAVFPRSAVKYGDRAYRLVLLEAGHAAQNLALAAVAAECGSVAWGGFYDDALNALLGVDGVDEAVVHCLFIGARGREPGEERA